jgi:hypothetical protein
LGVGSALAADEPFEESPDLEAESDFDEPEDLPPESDFDEPDFEEPEDLEPESDLEGASDLEESEAFGVDSDLAGTAHADDARREPAARSDRSRKRTRSDLRVMAADLLERMVVARVPRFPVLTIGDDVTTEKDFAEMQRDALAIHYSLRWQVDRNQAES